MAYQEALKNLGLGPKEIQIYLALLELGETTVLQIAKRADVKRPTAYIILQALEEKGYISRVIKKRGVLFSPQHPQKLLAESELHLKELKEVVPQLESLLHKGTGKPRVMIYEGKDALDRAYDELFITKGESVYMGTIQLSQDALPRTYKKIEYKTFSPAFSMRELIAETKEAREYAQGVQGPYRAIRFIPEELLPFEADIGIFGNRVLITSVRKEYFTISIESEEIRRAFQTIYDVMWKIGTV